MPRCKSVKKSVVTNQTMLVCDLTEGHENVHPEHYDKLESTLWRHASNEPTPVPATRTSPQPSKPARKARAVEKSVATHTGMFEVVTA